MESTQEGRVGDRPVSGGDGQATVPGAGLQVSLQGSDAGELGVGPLIEQLAHVRFGDIGVEHAQQA